MNKVVLVGLIIVGLTIGGCAVPLTQEGRMVRMIQPDWKNQCKFLGTESVSFGGGWTISDDVRKTRTMMKNKVAELGGNAYLDVGTYPGAFGTTIDFEVFNCPDNL